MNKEEINELKKGTKRYQTIAIILAFLGFFAGIYVGEACKTRELTYESAVNSSFNEYDEKFNNEATLYIWGATAGTVIAISFMYSVCHRLDLLIEKKDK